jgi:hypothetical protein
MLNGALPKLDANAGCSFCTRDVLFCSPRGAHLRGPTQGLPPDKDEKALLETIESLGGLNGTWNNEGKLILYLKKCSNDNFISTNNKLCDRV